MNKKAFQSNANRSLSDSPCFIVNKFEHFVCVGGGGGSTVRSKLNSFEYVLGTGPYTGTPSL